MEKKKSPKRIKWKLNKEKLYRLRMNKGWSQEIAADECKIYNVRQYIRLENGETKQPRTGTLKSLAHGFGISDVNELLLQSGASPLKSDYDFYVLNKSHTNNILNFRFKPIHNPKKLIVLGIDNTILKGYDFAWQLVWKHLNLDDKIRKNWIRNFHQGKMSLNKWVQMKSDLIIKSKLKKSDFNLILSKVSIIDGFEDFITYCNKNNYALAIVSGGIDTVLEFKIPNYQKIFNYVTINKFVYDEKGFLKNIIPTPYDFKTKVDGINAIQIDTNVSRSNTIFIGDGYNNIHTLHAAGTCISIDTNSIQLIEGFHHNINKPDLREVIKFLK